MKLVLALDLDFGYVMKLVFTLNLDFRYVMKLVLIWIWTWFWIWRIIQDIYEILIDLNMLTEICFVFKARMWTLEWNMLYVCIKYGYERAISMI